MSIEKVKAMCTKITTMKRITLLLLLAVLTTGMVRADNVSLQQALQTAAQFAQTPTVRQARARRAPGTIPIPRLAYTVKSGFAAGRANLYIIDYGSDQGYVIVSGESGTEDDVLGYCDHGSFHYDDCPIQLKALLEGYSASIDSLRRNPAQASQATRRAARGIGDIVVEPLLTTAWDQWAPYNNLCSAGCPTGCVPTALAQVMNFWQWPKESIGNLLNPSTGTFTGEDFAGHTYDWDNMLDNYASGYNATQAQAVAFLMADIGKAFFTNYAPDGSSTTWTAEPLVGNFGYEADVKTHNGGSADDIKADIALGRPVLLAFGTHALVADGYTSDGYIHLNYGWGGSGNGYYKLDAKKDLYFFTGVRPYDAVRKDIGNFNYGLLASGKAEIFDYIGGGVGVENGVLEIPSTVTDEGITYKVTRIRQRAFFRKGHFDKIIVGDNIEAVDPISFFYTNIDTLILSDKIEAVPDEAFAYTSIKSLTIGSSVKRIGKNAFALCKLNEVISKSPAFEVGETAFMGSTPDCGDWLECITKLGRKAFQGASFRDYKATWKFTNLEEIEDSVFLGASIQNSTPSFHIHPKVRKISPAAFDSWSTTSILNIKEENPYFSQLDGSNDFDIFNKNQTSLVLGLRFSYTHTYPETLVRLEPGCFRPMMQIGFVPATVVEMEGAFKDCPKLSTLRCRCPIPPVITDATFNDQIFENSPSLIVPIGTSDLYRNAPGWRRFQKIYEREAYDLMPVQNIEYRVSVQRKTDEQRNVSMRTADVEDIHIEGTNIVVSRQGQDDLTTDVSLVDSITFMPGFVYENAEIFDLNDSTLTAEGHKCSVTFSPTAIAGEVQLCIRNAVFKPNVVEGIARGQSVELSLSNGEHELSGVARITIPIEREADEHVQAAYLNEESGEWGPVLAFYDDQLQEAVILTDHLSLYSVFSVKNDYTRAAVLQTDFDVYFPYQELNDAVNKLLEIASSDDPEAEAIRAWKDDVGFWQSVGIDGGYSLLTALGFESEFLGGFFDIMGNMGTASTILDVIGADIRGDDIGVASNTLKTVMSLTVGKMASAVGTGIMSASMGLVAFVGVALEKLGTMVQQAKISLFRKAYRYYYSEECAAFGGGTASIFNNGNRAYRSDRDWYEYFRPAFEKGMKADNLSAYIEQSVRRYCEWFWEDNPDIYNFCMAEMDVSSMTTYMYPDESTMKAITDEYYAELCNNVLPDVFRAIKENLETKAAKRYQNTVRAYTRQMNTAVMVQFKDSECDEDGTSQYAGWKVRFSEVPDSIKDPNFWQCTLNEKGEGKIGYFSEYALIRNKIPCNVTLLNLNDEEQCTYDFTIPKGTGKLTITQDLAAGGIEIEVPKLENLHLTYEPQEIQGEITLSGTGMGIASTWETQMGTVLQLGETTLLKNARLQTEVERFFKEHKSITVDDAGNFRIGSDIVGQFQDNTGTATFTINVANPFTEQTVEDVVTLVNEGKSLLLYNNVLDGTILHKIDCQATVTCEGSGDDRVYAVSYTGQGTFDLTADVVDHIENMDFDNWPNGNQERTKDDVSTRELSVDGSVKLEYTTKLR